MNKDNAKDYLPLVKALAEGKTIQETAAATDGWYDVESPTFCLPPDYYRIKPEPLECWANTYSGRRAFHLTREEALLHATPDATRIAVHMREVTE